MVGAAGLEIWLETGLVALNWFGGFGRKIFLNFLRKYKSADAKGISRHHADRSA